MDAVIGLQARNTAPATTYLQFVEAHRSRADAQMASTRLQYLARTDSFANAKEWPANGYSHRKKAAPIEKSSSKPKRKR